ncbi:unnamed protein product [Allacma fusca]|uniref:Uncharacterized protein n=1 Tax=Allacma fusca TaxID=39272 RepID=A0A8J2JZF7_9HEXA|nr:unnamed protein product [Allacma fusca]
MRDFAPFWYTHMDSPFRNHTSKALSIWKIGKKYNFLESIVISFGYLIEQMEFIEASKLILISWTLATMVLNRCYTSFIESFLVHPLKDIYLERFEQFAKADYRITVDEPNSLAVWAIGNSSGLFSRNPYMQKFQDTLEILNIGGEYEADFVNALIYSDKRVCLEIDWAVKGLIVPLKVFHPTYTCYGSIEALQLHGEYFRFGQPLVILLKYYCIFQGLLRTGFINILIKFVLTG